MSDWRPRVDRGAFVALVVAPTIYSVLHLAGRSGATVDPATVLYTEHAPVLWRALVTAHFAAFVGGLTMLAPVPAFGPACRWREALVVVSGAVLAVTATVAP